MRVITGSARGRKLISPIGMDVRPTTDKVKEAVFSAIQFNIPDSYVLDLFAGSGQMGIEALSRGAARAFFIDSSKDSIKVITENLRTTKLDKFSEVILRDSYDYISLTTRTFDIIILDPPYRFGHIYKVLPLAAAKLNPGGIIICEYEADAAEPQPADGLILRKTYKYGKICVSIFCKPDSEDDK
ncbi:MAG: 16S rRNA (guanine(966)-N(2))-methyltransferase RsmD [Ruminococcus sp.]|nr:16S rRNA (guanine(966)-N(2))-methyltransferase RsmD [Ruminococcus sp.]